MKKLFLIAAVLVLLVGCAKTSKEVQFVPLQISWQMLGDVDSDTPYVSSCMVRMTNALMADPNVQSHASENISYEAAVSAKSVGDAMNLEFAGVCSADVNLAKELCSWTAVCNAEGSIEKINWN